MRKLIVSNLMSIDGFVATDDGNLPIAGDPEPFNLYNAERARNMSTLICGRKSFEMFEGYWPSLETDDSIDDTQRAISKYNNRANKIVVSDGYEVSAASPWAASTEVVCRKNAAAMVAKEKEQPGEDIIVFGSATTWNPLLQAGLVNEMHLMISPAIAGGGASAFKNAVDAALTLIDIKRFEGSSYFVVQYGVN